MSLVERKREVLEKEGYELLTPEKAIEIFREKHGDGPYVSNTIELIKKGRLEVCYDSANDSANDILLLSLSDEELDKIEPKVRETVNKVRSYIR